MFQRFTLRTHLIYWDDSHFWMEHLFETKGRTVAISKNLAKGKNGVASTQDAFELLNHEQPTAVRPEKIEVLQETEELLKSLQTNSVY